MSAVNSQLQNYCNVHAFVSIKLQQLVDNPIESISGSQQ